MRKLALLFALVGCSDYDLQHGKAEGPKGETTGGTGTTEVVDTSAPEDTDDPDTDTHPVEGTPEGKIDVVLLLDLAYSYDCYHPELATNGAALVDALFDSGADVAIAIATYDDYNVDGKWWVAWGGVPYLMTQQLTTDRAALKSDLAAIEMTWGGDGPGTGYEAMLQATSGIGYDQDCDGSFDSDTDIRPFQASSSDAFGGSGGSAYNSGVSGSGSTAGVGFRADSKRVVILFAENQIRDREEGHEMPTGTCPDGASKLDAAQAVRAVGAELLGVNSYEFQDIDPVLQVQLLDLVDRTGSLIDADGDGVKDDPAVLSGSWDWPPVGQLVDAIWDLAGG